MNPLYDTDFQFIDEFIANPKHFMDNDAEIAINVKKLYDKRKKQIQDRA